MSTNVNAGDHVQVHVAVKVHVKDDVKVEVKGRVAEHHPVFHSSHT